MNKASFKIRKSKLKNELANMRKAYRAISKRTASRVLEMTITDNLLTLVIPGAKLEVPCETFSTAKATIDFLYFYDIIKTWEGLLIEINFIEDEMQIGKTKIKVQTTFFENDSILRSIKLPLNYTDWHLLKLEQRGYTIEELRFNKLNGEVENAHHRLKYNVSYIKDVLGIYGISSKEILDLIEQKIKL
ncbi:hypothetical protein FLGE108171_14560 [Flavobacterium gelidilacus]|uniref:hypothetical protein n=1 Tax=Flavobacterium gelidilacus TaxID=206041 RepID=UPI00041062B9|nr:hypothetical protein [Flavobacterium gelidilacus]